MQAGSRRRRGTMSASMAPCSISRICRACTLLITLSVVVEPARAEAAPPASRRAVPDFASLILGEGGVVLVPGAQPGVYVRFLAVEVLAGANRRAHAGGPDSGAHKGGGPVYGAWAAPVELWESERFRGIGVLPAM